MSLDADFIVDRRRMRRKLTFWRVLTVLVAVAAVVGGALLFTGNREIFSGGPGGSIARVTIKGLIRGGRERVEALERLAKSNAKAVIVHINSPGGTVSGSEELYDSLMRVKAKKPVVVVVDGLAASGGYIAAMAGERIWPAERDLGSIGVIFQYPNVTELLKTIGVRSRRSSRRRSRRRPTASSRPAPRRARRSRRSSRTPTPGSAAWWRSAAISTASAGAASPTAACSPAARRSSSS